jgi:molybdopterin synthase catalytic subunit
MIRSSSFRPAAEVKAAGPEGAGVKSVAAEGVEAKAIWDEPLDMAGMLAAAHHPGAGAVVLFSGEVRDRNLGRAVSFLEYEAHGPLAEKMIGDILSTARAKWKLQIAVARHRIGKVAIGETAVVVITASAHRSEAFEANRYIIDRIKHEAPIWKCEYYADGTREWGDNCHCNEKPFAGEAKGLNDE